MFEKIFRDTPIFLQVHETDLKFYENALFKYSLELVSVVTDRNMPIHNCIPLFSLSRFLLSRGTKGTLGRAVIAPDSLCRMIHPSARHDSKCSYSFRESNETFYFNKRILSIIRLAKEQKQVYS